MGSLKISVKLPVAPEMLYKAWLSSKEHTAFTGDKAIISPKKGSKFSVFGGYISGKTIELIPHHVIVQRWRTSEFDKSDPDSLLSVIIEPNKKGSTLTLIQVNIPKRQIKKYKAGWIEYYFKPMIKYFSNQKSNGITH